MATVVHRKDNERLLIQNIVKILCRKHMNWVYRKRQNHTECGIEVAEELQQ